MKIRSVKANNRREAFEVTTANRRLVFPFSRLEVQSTGNDAVAPVGLDVVQAAQDLPAPLVEIVDGLEPMIVRQHRVAIVVEALFQYARGRAHRVQQPLGRRALSTMNRTAREPPLGPVTTPPTYVSPTASQPREKILEPIPVAANVHFCRQRVSLAANDGRVPSGGLEAENSPPRGNERVPALRRAT